MNDERPIEKLLRRYAKKRRDEAGAPLELHPATRRLLQREVARQLGKAGAEESPSAGWLALLRAKWVYATAAACAVVAAVGLVVFNHKPDGPEELAGRKAAPVEAPALGAGGALAKAADRAPLSDALTPTIEEKKAQLEDLKPVAAPSRSGEAAAVVASAAPASSPVTPPAPAVSPGLAEKEVSPATAPEPAGAVALAEGRDAFTRRYGLAPTTAPAPATRTAPVPTRARATTDALAESQARREASVAAAPAVKYDKYYAPIARGGGVEARGQAGNSQAFVDLAKGRMGESTNAPAATTTPVLRYFQVVQAGDQWQVIDADGSTYTGKVIVPIQAAADDEAKGAAKLKSATAEAFGGVALAPANNNFFRVSGTNRTLNQQVVFTWNFVERTNLPGATVTQFVGGNVFNQSQLRTQQLPGLYNNQGISGRAQINAGKEFEVRATPVNP